MDASRTSDQPYTLLPEDPSVATPPVESRQRRPIRGFIGILASVMFLLSLVGLIVNENPKSPSRMVIPENNLEDPSNVRPRGEMEGVSAKSYPSVRDRLSYNWTKSEFAWQRTAYHFQPEKNWMNGPLFHMGWYHLFYQYNPDSAVWGNITWGHTISRDLIHWLYLPLAMVPDHWYDINGVWTGSATTLPNGTIVMLYTGDTNDAVQVQNLAYPANLSDPLLLDWVKYSDNPVITPPTGIETDEFRDPTTAWAGPNGTWHILIGSRLNTTIGIALVYETTDFKTYNLLDHPLHTVNGTGMWECVDFYPISTNSTNGLDTSVTGPGIKHVLKASLDNLKLDYYAIGTYNAENVTWTPDDQEMDVGIGLQVDYGRYYASKTFYDQNKGRRILWGWINETDTEYDDLAKGWASVQTIPRVVTYDNKTRTNILQWPVEEIESLRLNCTEFEDVALEPGSLVPLDIGMATQLDISAEFEIQSDSLEAMLGETPTELECSVANNRTSLGPFGLAVLADESLSELTPIYFRIVKTANGSLMTLFCTDESRSSKATEVFRRLYGTVVPVLHGEKFTMRILVDHSIVESFAQGGRRVITSRVYPTEAIYGNAKLFLFNNATDLNVTATLKIWEMNSAFIHPFPFNEM
ncbi:hypothetical protein CDL15_Pgr022869 [Punica granatum]|uniref:beta-fructofuranosidase n=1 Tax=Punica granatum TaxID=22663 RepID=A0A218X3B1_PUNGR|nr:hypothetical protein CDL15_Pgr022869 [Punica granatum]